MSKSTTRRARCMSCGVEYNTKRPHICSTIVERGTNSSEPQKARSRKLMFGKGKR